MNKIFKRLTGSHRSKKQKRNYPFTAAFDLSGICIGMADGVKALSDFPNADILNVIHRNGKTTIIKNTTEPR